MNGYCISDQYCRYKSDTGYCGYTGGCVLSKVTTMTIPKDMDSRIVRIVDISADSTNAIADAVVKKLKGEQTEQQWIPVTERLPDKYTTVIVSCVDNSGDTPFSYTACGYWVGLLPDDDPAWIVDGEVNYHVVAWMELPEPYKEGQEWKSV